MIAPARTSAPSTTREARSANPIVITPRPLSTPASGLAAATTAPAAQAGQRDRRGAVELLVKGQPRHVPAAPPQVGVHDHRHPHGERGGQDQGARERPHRAEVHVQRTAILLAHPLDPGRDLGLRDPQPDDGGPRHHAEGPGKPSSRSPREYKDGGRLDGDHGHDLPPRDLPERPRISGQTRGGPSILSVVDRARIAAQPACRRSAERRRVSMALAARGEQAGEVDSHAQQELGVTGLLALRRTARRNPARRRWTGQPGDEHARGHRVGAPAPARSRRRRGPR